MRKFVWIPAVELGAQRQGRIIEIMSEPRVFGGVSMQALRGSIFEKHLNATKTALKQLGYSPTSAHLYLTGYLPNLSNSSSLPLGLLIASLLQEKNCRFQAVLITGQIELTKPSLPITANKYFSQKLKVMLSLGMQQVPIPFYYPRDMQLKDDKALIAQCINFNIIPKPIIKLSDILTDIGIDRAY